MEIIVVFDEDKLWTLMCKKKVSPKALIQEIDCDPRAFADWITGNATPRPSNLRRMARLLGVEVAALTSEREQHQ